MKGYFFIADLIGFGNIVKNSDEQSLSERIESWVKIIHEGAEQFGIEKFQLISDTVFVGMDDDPTSLDTLVDFSKYLLEVGVRNSFPVRGAITYGTYEWGTLTYGKAVISAHKIEASQNWVGITCGGGMPHIDRFWDFERVVCYMPPFKSGPMILHPVIVWDIPDFDDLVRFMISKGLARGGEALSWQFADKLKNTVEFRNYLRLVKYTSQSPHEFKGRLPSELISLSLRVP